MPESSEGWSTVTKYDTETLSDMKARAITAGNSIRKNGHAEPWDGLFDQYDRLTSDPNLDPKGQKTLAQVKKGLFEAFGESAPLIFKSWKDAEEKRKPAAKDEPVQGT